MFNFFTAAALLTCLCIAESSVDNKDKTITGIDQREVCKIKRSCVECLHLTHCYWCLKEEKCFSNELEPNKCDETTKYTDHGFSLQENAKCSCNQTETLRCQPDGEEETMPPCSGRGECVCGRCVCETYENSSKIVMGDFCEFDNFSCNGPECNEGPYSITQAKDKEEP